MWMFSLFKSSFPWSPNNIRIFYKADYSWTYLQFSLFIHFTVCLLHSFHSMTFTLYLSFIFVMLFYLLYSHNFFLLFYVMHSFFAWTSYNTFIRFNHCLTCCRENQNRSKDLLMHIIIYIAAFAGEKKQEIPNDKSKKVMFFL